MIPQTPSKPQLFIIIIILKVILIKRVESTIGTKSTYYTKGNCEHFLLPTLEHYFFFPVFTVSLRVW